MVKHMSDIANIFTTLGLADIKDRRENQMAMALFSVVWDSMHNSLGLISESTCLRVHGFDSYSWSWINLETQFEKFRQ